MSDKQYYTAYVLDNGQLLRYAFEYKIIEFWAEAESQHELKEYFKEHHYTHDEPLIVEVAEFMDFMPYVKPSPTK